MVPAPITPIRLICLISMIQAAVAAGRSGAVSPPGGVWRLAGWRIHVTGSVDPQGPGAVMLQSAVAGLLVVAAQALFLWMFLATDPLEQVAVGLSPQVRVDLFAFAAAWRHGMAGNSPLYMPGFFAVATTAWLGLHRFDARGLWGLAGSLGAALIIALAAAPAGAARVAAHACCGAPLILPELPPPGFRAIIAGTYTLITWTWFVVGVRRSIECRTLRPLLPVPVLTAGLMVVRPWTVDEFTSTWWQRVAAGDPVAVASAALVPPLAVGLVAWTRSARITASRSREAPNESWSAASRRRR
jgi:hypothetical protein